jgi:hypothetical protein
VLTSDAVVMAKIVVNAGLNAWFASGWVAAG